eukprot:g999.t1
MVGYILGLGDRHPSNLMLARGTGKIVHIDFGDCFEVAMDRDKFPEKVPFRLTRMLVNAMEVSGIEGNFRNTCETVMHVLRENRDSVMAICEAFVYDPLISWRLLTPETVPVGPGGAGAAARTSAGQEKAEEEDEETESDDDDEAPDEIEQHTVHKRLGFTRRASEDNVVDPRRLREDAVASAAAAAESDAHGVSIKSSMNNSIGSSIEESMTAVMPEKLNARAVKVIKRVQQKLDGRDFTTVRVAKAGESSPDTTRYYGFGGEGEEVNKAARGRVLSVEEQVDRLIMQATSDENLCQSYIGWYVAPAEAYEGDLYDESAFRTVLQSTLNPCPLHNSLTSTAVCVYIPFLAFLFWPFVSLQVPVLVTCDMSAGMQQCI